MLVLATKHHELPRFDAARPRQQLPGDDGGELLAGERGPPVATSNTNGPSDDAAWGMQKLARGNGPHVSGGTDWLSEKRGLGVRRAWEWLLDADLGVLAAPPAVYLHYAEAVRSEYCHVPDAEFRWVATKEIYLEERSSTLGGNCRPRTGEGMRVDCAPTSSRSMGASKYEMNEAGDCFPIEGTLTRGAVLMLQPLISVIWSCCAGGGAPLSSTGCWHVPGCSSASGLMPRGWRKERGTTWLRSWTG